MASISEAKRKVEADPEAAVRERLDQAMTAAKRKFVRWALIVGVLIGAVLHFLLRR
jgi:hypothetical protein